MSTKGFAMDNTLTPIEDLMMNIPGAQTPMGRMLVFGGAGTAFAYAVRPSMSFFEDGSPRPWIITDSKNPQATLFPYWAYTVLPALVFGVFV